MVDVLQSALKVALVAEEGKQRGVLQDLLRKHQIDVVACLALSELSPDSLHQLAADVILIDLVEEPEESALEFLIESAPAPILFSESQMSSGRDWGTKLVDKLMALADRSRAVRASDLSASPLPEPAPVSAAPRPALKVVAEVRGGEVEEPLTLGSASTAAVCVLGASIGGPDAVKMFLSLLPEDLPIAFLLAQHIGMGFDHRLADQLSRATRLDVRMAQEGDVLTHGEVLVVPTQGRLEVNRQGEVIIKDAPWSGPYSPTINDVMGSVARHFGAMSSAILFSGMGNDGASGAQEIAAVGGQVWVQDEASCVISSIPDSARQRGVVTYSGTPKQLAERLMHQCRRQVVNGE